MTQPAGRRARASGVLPFTLLCGALAGCATSTVPTPRPVAPDLLQAVRDSTASNEAEAARRAAAAGRLREALWRWRAVEAVARDPAPAHAEAARLLAQAEAQAAVEAARGEADRRTRDRAGTVAAFQAALQLDPQQPVALAGLREIETVDVLGRVSEEQSAARRPKRRARTK